MPFRQSVLAALGERRVLVVVMAVVVSAAVATALLVRAAGDESETRPVTASDTSSPVPEEQHDHEEGEHEEGEHEHDHVDTVDPDIDPSRYVEFCEAFYVFAGAYSNAVDTLDETDEAPDFLVSAATDFRAVADRTEMTDEVRAGFEWFVDDVLRVANDASTEEQLAWSTFLNSACPA